MQYTQNIPNLCHIYAPQAQPTATAEVLRIATYNIHYCEGTDGLVSIGRVAEWIRENQVDVLVVNEIDDGWDRTGNECQPALLSAEAGLPYVLFAPAVQRTPNMLCGNAIMSRLPMKQMSSQFLPRLGEREYRNLLHASIHIPSTTMPINIWGTHLAHGGRAIDTEQRVQQSQDIARYAKPEGIAFLLGDMNATPDEGEMRCLTEAGWVDLWIAKGLGSGHTFPAANPRIRIDYIYASPDAVQYVKSIRVMNTPASDHLPVIMEFDASVLNPAIDSL